MNYLVDIIFDELKLNKLTSLIRYICGQGVINDYEFNFKEGKYYNVDIENLDNLENYFLDSYDFGARFNSVKINKLEIPNVSLVTNIHGNNQYSLTLSFDSHDVCKNLDYELVTLLMHNVNKVAKMFGVVCCFSGIDSAFDIENRFFTNNEIGIFTKVHLLTS